MKITVILRKIKTAFYLLLQNPKLFIQVTIMNYWMFFPKSPLCKCINGVKFEFDFHYDAYVCDMFLERYEVKTVTLIRKNLKKGDTFIDVGANIGYLSAIAAGCVGNNGQVHSFEPVPEYFLKLLRMSEINYNYKISCNNCAVGETEGMVRIHVSDVGNFGHNTIVSGLLSRDQIKESVDVPIIRLDNYIFKNHLDNISLIKIDTEGFEYFVLKGMELFFKMAKFLPPIICEITPEAYSFLNCSINDLFNHMALYSYMPYDLVDTNKVLVPDDIKKLSNVIFIQEGCNNID